MKVLVVIPALGEIYGGPSRVVPKLTQAMGKLDVHIDVVTTNANGSTRAPVRVGEEVKENNYHIRYFSYLDFMRHQISFQLINWLIPHVKDYQLVHIHSVFSVTIMAAYLACSVARIPYVVTPHGMLEPWALSHKKWKKAPYYILIERQGLRRASMIHALSANEANNIQHLGLGVPISIVPNGIDPKDFKSPISPTEFYKTYPGLENKKIILFLGRIDPKKGLDILAKAFQVIYAKQPEAHLVIAGPDNIGFLPKVKGYFSNAQCLNAVTFTGMLEGTLKNSALSAASVYVAPSHSEGFSMSILEAMAAGLPCVITTGCNFPEAGDAGVACVVEARSTSVAAAVLSYLADESRARFVGAKARDFILKNYTWNSIAEKMAQLYQGVLDHTYSCHNRR